MDDDVTRPGEKNIWIDHVVIGAGSDVAGQLRAWRDSGLSFRDGEGVARTITAAVDQILPPGRG
jgi:hypothetical protein